MPTMPTHVETVKIKCPENKRSGYAVINKSDFDESTHELFDAPVKSKPAAKKASAKKADPEPKE